MTSVLSQPTDAPRRNGLTAAVTPRLARRLAGLLSLDDFERAARRHLPRPLFGYIAGAAEDERSRDANRQAFTHYGFSPRVMVDVSMRDGATTLFGQRIASPFGLAPVGLSALAAYRGDLVLATAAAQAGIPMIMSGSSLIAMEQVCDAAPGTWFQAYLPGDETKLLALVDRVRHAGFKTLVITVDVPVWANRENNLRSGFSTPLRPSLRLAWDGIVRPSWLLGTLLRTFARHGMPHFENSFATRGAPMFSASAVRDTTGRDHLNWQHLRQIRERWPGVLIVKGVLDVRDARTAIQHGVDGLIVSNHGGRQLDGAAAPLQMLPAIVDAVGDSTVVMVDGGVRRGTDVIKALALGARCVFAGRPFIYAAAVGGSAGVQRAIQLLHDEIDRDMAMLGLSAIAQIDRECLVPLHPSPRAPH